MKKKTGDYRLCIDNRRLYVVTVIEKYLLQLIDDQIDMLGAHKYFITLDLTSEYFQIPVLLSCLQLITSF